MRPNRLRTVLSLAGVGAITAGTMLGAGIARADTVDDYVQANAPIVCTVMDSHPSVSGIEGIALAIMDEGFTPEASGEIVGRSIIGWCPEHARAMQGFIDKWADSSSVKRKSKAA